MPSNELAPATKSSPLPARLLRDAGGGWHDRLEDDDDRTDTRRSPRRRDHATDYAQRRNRRGAAQGAARRDSAPAPRAGCRRTAARPPVLRHDGGLLLILSAGAERPSAACRWRCAA